MTPGVDLLHQAQEELRRAAEIAADNKAAAQKLAAQQQALTQAEGAPT